MHNLRHWKTSPRLALTALVGVTAIWGWTFLIVKDAIRYVPVMDFLAVRFTIAALVMFLIRPVSLWRLSSQGWWRGVLLGLLLGGSYITQTYGLLTVSPAVSGFITGMAVVFTPVIAWLILRNSISLKTWLVVVLALVGLALMSLHGWSFSSGELLTLGCALFVAFQIIGLSKWASQHDIYSLALVQILTTAVITVLAAAPGGIVFSSEPSVWWTAGITAVLATAVAFLVQTWAQSLVSPTYAAIVLTMEPVFAGIFSVVFGSEQLTLRIILGAICILVAMLLVQLKPVRRRTG